MASLTLWYEKTLWHLQNLPYIEKRPHKAGVPMSATKALTSIPPDTSWAYSMIASVNSMELPRVPYASRVYGSLSPIIYRRFGMGSFHFFTKYLHTWFHRRAVAWWKEVCEFKGCTHLITEYSASLIATVFVSILTFCWLWTHRWRHKRDKNLVSTNKCPHHSSQN